MNFRTPANPELDDAFCDICEEVTFALLDPATAEELADLPGPHYRALVRLDGCVRGEVEVAGDLPGAVEMAGNLLPPAERPGGAEDNGIRFLEELANITAGVFAGLVTDAEGACDFSAPESAPISSGHWRRLCDDAWSRCYLGDEGALIWRCRLAEPATGRVFRPQA